MIGQGAMMMAEGGETDRKGYIFGGKTRSTRDIDDIDDNESIQLLGFGPSMKGSNYKKLFGNKVAEGGETDNEGRAPERIVARRTRQTPNEFRLGIDPEFMYFETPLNPSAAEVMGTSSSRRPTIPPLIPTNTMSYGIPGVIDPYKAFDSQIMSPVAAPVVVAETTPDPVAMPTVDVEKSVAPALLPSLPDLTNLVNLGLMDGSSLIPNFGEGLGFNEGGDTDKKLPNKGLEALDKVAPEVVERMGFRKAIKLK